LSCTAKTKRSIAGGRRLCPSAVSYRSISRQFATFVSSVFLSQLCCSNYGLCETCVVYLSQSLPKQTVHGKFNSLDLQITVPSKSFPYFITKGVVLSPSLKAASLVSRPVNAHGPAMSARSSIHIESLSLPNRVT
jgi:hypothetical protein